MSERKTHLSIVIAGHVDAGKSTTTGHLLFKLGGIDPREMEKLQKEADERGKSTFAFAYYMDKRADERERGITIDYTTKEFFTNNYHYSIIDAPGHRDFVKNMISGASQADVALLLVPADSGFAASLAKGDHADGSVPGQTRQHARLINLLGIKQIIIGVNKMDSDSAQYKQERFDEVANEMRNVLIQVGYKKEYVADQVPIIPLSGFKGDNLIEKSANMPWWNGANVEGKNINTLLDALNEFAKPPVRKEGVPFRLPVSQVCNIKGVGTVVTGRIEQGLVKPNDEVKFLPTHTASNSCAGKVFTIEMHHKSVDVAHAGDNVGINVKGLDKKLLPKPGDVMVLKSDTSLAQCKRMTAMVQVVDHPNEIKPGYCPIGTVRTAKSALKLVKINKKMGKETGGKWVEDPTCLKKNEAAEVVFEPQRPLVVEKFANCEGLGRLAIMEGNSVVMIGKVMGVEF